MMATACRDGLSPQDILGHYMLVRVDSASLPAVFDETPTLVRRVISDFFEIDTPTKATEHRTLEVEDLTAGTVAQQFSHSDYAVRTTGSRIELYYICPPNALCSADIAPLVAERTADGLRITGGHQSHTLFYHRVAVLSLPH